jgi:hypothetical protein
MPQKSRAYYTKAGTSYKPNDARNGVIVWIVRLTLVLLL